MEASSLFSGILLILSLISLAVISSLIFKKLNFPYTIGLVVVGIVIGVVSVFFPGLTMFRDLQITSDTIMYLILPVLIFDAALNVDSKVLFKNIVPISALLAIGLLISAFVVGGLLSLTLGLSFGAMLLFGALISATDPVAVIALFKEANAPKRLTTIIDGESMSNDATAIVLYGIVFALTYNTAAVSATASLNIPGAILQFFIVLFGGTAVGAVVGILGAFICKLDKGDRNFQVVLSVIMAYVAFIIADKLGFSGVMGTLVAGVVLSFRAEDVIKRRNREQVEAFWGFFSFLANSFVFLLIGITQVHVFRQSPIDGKSGIYIAVSIVILLAARYISVIACNAPYNFFVRKKKPELIIPHSYSLILTWGGLRGAIPAALALAIPVDYPLRNLIVQLTLACILFSLLVQGTTIKWLMTKLGIKPEDTEIDEGKCAKKEFPFPNRGLIDLVIPKVIKHCEDEGFFVREKKMAEHEDYLMRMHKHMFLFRVTNEHIEVIAEHEDMGYASTIMYETMVELNQSLSSIEAVVNPKNLNQMISNNDDSDEKSLVEKGADLLQKLRIPFWMPQKDTQTTDPQSADQASGDTNTNTSPEQHSSQEHPVKSLLSDSKGGNLDFIKYLSQDSVVVPLRSTKKRQVIYELLATLEMAGKISNPIEVTEAVFAREKSMSTGLGNGIALPRTRTDTVQNITVAIGVSDKGVRFDAVDKKPVYIVALVLAPQKDSTPYMEVLSEIENALSKANIREKIINAKTPEELYRILKEKDW